MDREHEYRVWDKFGKQFVPLKTLVWNSVTGELKGAYVEKQGEPGFNISVNDMELSEFTGLKDKNGVKIYEDDIVMFTKAHNEESYVGLVKYCQEVAGFMLTSKEDWCATEFGLSTVNLKIIGNIYDNPELIGAL